MIIVRNSDIPYLYSTKKLFESMLEETKECINQEIK